MQPIPSDIRTQPISILGISIQYTVHMYKVPQFYAIIYSNVALHNIFCKYVVASKK